MMEDLFLDRTGVYVLSTHHSLVMSVNRVIIIKTDRPVPEILSLLFAHTSTH